MNNKITLESYELGVDAYVAGAPAEVSGSMKTWLDSVLEILPKDARIIEIGSAFGRDAHYMQARGFQVECTDATMHFVALLKEKGFSARPFNILTEEFTSFYDLIFANAVFLHFTPQELRKVLEKARASLSKNGMLAFSVKYGEGEEWSKAKIGNPRYFCYWSNEKIQLLLKEVGFNQISVVETDKFLLIKASLS